jgi:F0F1-type ATP synthase assembly protein I
MVASLALAIVIYNRIMKRIETLILGILACAFWDIFIQSIVGKETLPWGFTALLVIGLLVGLMLHDYFKKNHFAGTRAVP